MTPSARIQAAIEILDGLAKTAQPADRYLRDWFGARRYAGSKDRVQVSQHVYDVLRRRAYFSWRMGEGARACVLASLLHDGKSPAEIEELFSGTQYAPASLADDERARLSSEPEAEPPPHVRGEYPQWLEGELKRAFGPDLPQEMEAMLSRAPVDLRVNTLRATREVILEGLTSLGVACHATPYSPYGIRVPSASGLAGLRHTQFFETGAFEIQDEGSQIASILCGAKPGSHVLDLAAGGGGKSLALAAIMENRGDILAYDFDETRLKDLRPRARRAGAAIIRTTDKKDGWGKFDIVLADAPCSGSGTWRRSPEQKWRLSPQRLAQLLLVQGDMLDDSARHVGEGGRLVYVTCSVLPSENEDIVAGFLKGHPDFAIIPAADAWQGATSLAPPPGMGQFFRGSPLKCGTDGFFVCIMQTK
jgi:16S rRNA (cytosine967-C5)-methyltransferase